MGSFDGGAVFKLGMPEHAQALALDGSVSFDPSGTRSMREWVVVGPAQQDVWVSLALAAIRYVR